MNLTPTVIFVCEHGAAKSIVAAAYFNKFVAEKGIKLRAIARGTHPDEELASGAIQGLRADGLTVEEQKPVKLSDADTASAICIVAFCELPQNFYSAVSIFENWDDVPPISGGYEKSRAIITQRIQRLLDTLATM
jgi:protein-tyrosine-phosphatase